MIVSKLVWLVISAAAAVACGGGQNQVGSTLRPLEERRARAVIEEAISESGIAPARPRVVALPEGATLAEDMAIEGGKYGVAYLTVPEAEALGAAIPAYDPDQGALTLARGSSGEVILLLYEQDFRYDAGADHTTNFVTVERKLRRDVTDYVLHVVKPDKVQ